MPIYGLTYHKLAQTSYFKSDVELSRNDLAVIDLDQGRTLARVVSGPHADLENLEENALPRLVRYATAEDLRQEKANQETASQARAFWVSCVHRRRLDMKLVDVEVFLDRSKFIFYFTAPARIDFRELVKDLVHEYRVRIELRQIGVRHEAQMVGAVGNCGMVCCCRRYLRQFAPVTIRMAKEQNLFLNPAKVSGICGRLLCCLSYEQTSYDAFHRESPRLGKHYQVQGSSLKVIRTNMFCNTVTCLNEKNEEVHYTLDEWKNLRPERTDAAVPQAPQAQNTAANPQDELVVVQATLDSVTDPDFFNDYFPPGSENYDEMPVISRDPVMEPGQDEARPRRKRKKKPGRGSSPQTGRPSPLHGADWHGDVVADAASGGKVQDQGHAQESGGRAQDRSAQDRPDKGRHGAPNPTGAGPQGGQGGRQRPPRPHHEGGRDERPRSGRPDRPRDRARDGAKGSTQESRKDGSRQDSRPGKGQTPPAER